MLGYSGDNKIKNIIITPYYYFSLLGLFFTLFPFFFLSSPISSTPYIRNNIRTNPH